MSNKILILFSCVNVFDVTLFNYYGVSITKYSSAAARATVDLCRIICVWVVSVAFGLEVFKASFLPGFLILCTGFVIYNEIVIVPCFGLDKNTAYAQNKLKVARRVSRVDSLLNGDY